MSSSFSMYSQSGEVTEKLKRIQGTDSFELPFWYAPREHEVFMLLEKCDHSLTFSKEGERQGADFKHILDVPYLQVTVFLKTNKHGDEVHVDRCCLRYDAESKRYSIECENIVQGPIDEVNRKTKSIYAKMIQATLIVLVFRKKVKTRTR